MPLRDPDSPACYEHSADAEVALAELDLNEELAQRWASETVIWFQDEYARMFREAVGVGINERAAYRAALEQIREYGHEPVSAARQRFAQPNDSSDGAGMEATAED